MGHPLLAESRELCADASRRELQAVHPQHARAWHSGPRPVERLRLSRLRPHHGWYSRAQRKAARSFAPGVGGAGTQREGRAMRKAALDRTTKETSIRLRLMIEGRGKYKISTGIRFLDHMLELFAHHGGFDLEVAATGDLDVDQHHTVEDVGIALGQAFAQALGNKKGILRAGYFVMPMDETLGLAAVDFSGRAAAVVDTKVRVRVVGDLQSELVHDFFDGFARGAQANVHARILYGRSNHHKIEALFKAFARAVRAACWRDKQMARLLPSTKGLL